MLAIYEPLLRQWLSGQHLPQADVDDLLQDTLVVVCQKVAEFDHNGRTGAFRHWLKAIVVNRSREFWRKGRLRSQVAESQAFSVLDQMEDPRSDMSNWWDREHDCNVVRRLLALIRDDFAQSRFPSAILRRVSVQQRRDLLVRPDVIG